MTERSKLAGSKGSKLASHQYIDLGRTGSSMDKEVPVSSQAQ